MLVPNRKKWFLRVVKTKGKLYYSGSLGTSSVTWTPRLAKWVAARGRLETLQWIWLDPRSSSFPERDAIEIIEFAARKGHLAVVTWLNEHQQWTDDGAEDRFAGLIDKFVSYRHFQVARYLVKHGASRARVQY